MLFQEPVDDLGLGFLFGEAECHGLDELIAGDLADGGLAVSMGSYPMDGSISGVAGWRCALKSRIWYNTHMSLVSLIFCAAFLADDLTPPAVFARTEGAPVAIVRAGEALAPIVTDAEPRNVAAARELASVINSMSGVRPKIIREAKGQSASVDHAIFIGDVSGSRLSGLSAPTNHPEAFRVAVIGGSVHFLGRADYAVYDWCERQLGVRCYWRDADGDEVSVLKSTEIVADCVDYSDWPVFSKRICGSCGNQRWAKYSKSGSSHRGGVRVHAPHKWHKDADLVAEHPDIFALDPDGRRAGTPMLCYGNPKTLEYYEQRIDEAIAGVRDADGIVDVKRRVITVSPWDAVYDCRCEYCTPLYDRSRGERGYASPVVWGCFLKSLAKWAKERHPDYLISFLPYWTMCEVPPGLDLREEGNCEAEVCVMPGLALLKSDTLKAREERIIRDWTRITGCKAILWHYTCWPAEYTFAPYLFGETARRHFGEMRNDVDGCFICGGDEVPRLSLMYYVMMRCMWNPKVDVDAIYDGFAQRMFGPAARPMRRLLDLQERGWMKRWPNDRLLDGNIYGFSYPPWTVREMKRCLERAERLAADDALALRRVRRYAQIFDDFFKEAEIVGRGAPRRPLSITGPKSAGQPRNFVLAVGPRLDSSPSMATEVRARWTEDGVTFSFRCEEPDVAGMPDGVAQSDDISQDQLGIIIEFGDVCRHIKVDAAGRVSMFVDNVPHHVGGLSVSVSKGEGEWFAEISIPFTALGEGAREALAFGVWRGNLVRWRPKHGNGQGEWSRLSTRRSRLNKDRDALVPFVATPF